MKKILTMILMFSIFIIPISSYASVENNCTTLDKKISYDQYINQIMKEKKISKEKAILEDSKNTSLYKKEASLGVFTPMIADDTVYYTSREQVYSFNTTFRSKIGATFKVYFDRANNKKEILNTTNMYTGPNQGSGSYTWNQLGSVWSDVSGGYPTKSIIIGGSGYFQIITTSSASAGIDLGGFSFSGSISGNNIYNSRTINMSMKVDAYSL